MANDRQKILRAINREGRKIRDPRARKVFLKAAVETGIVESGLSNPSGGDADSAGWRQERASLYANPTNIKASAKRFREEFQQHYDPGEASYEVAAQVQRPAAQYRGRYKDVASQAERIVSGLGGAPNVRTGSGDVGSDVRYRTVPGVDKSADRQALRVNYLSERGKPGALLDLAAGLKGAVDTPDRQVKVQGSGNGAGSAAGGTGGVHGTGVALASAAKQEADRISSAKVPYQWGGGHGGKQKAGSKVTPLDCSGAVSRVLGLDPRVSGEFAKWGKPGKGRVTVYSNSKHVLMEIDGHFFGTSSSNPGGGAGWIPRSQISKQYLKGFTARHA